MCQHVKGLNDLNAEGAFDENFVERWPGGFLNKMNQHQLDERVGLGRQCGGNVVQSCTVNCHHQMTRDCVVWYPAMVGIYLEVKLTNGDEQSWQEVCNVF